MSPTVRLMAAWPTARKKIIRTSFGTSIATKSI
jgi:hypothetical protein